MRFISKSPRYKTFPVHEKVERLADGSTRQITPGVVARFDHESPLEDHEIETARAAFHFTGTMQEEDEVTPVDPIVRVSVYDTEKQERIENWPEGLRATVEKALLNHNDHGRDFVVAEVPMPALPWNNYEEMDDVEEIVKLVVQLDLSPAAVARYEGRTKKRSQVIAALAALPEPQAVEVVRG